MLSTESTSKSSPKLRKQKLEETILSKSKTVILHSPSDSSTSKSKSKGEPLRLKMRDSFPLIQTPEASAPENEMTEPPGPKKRKPRHNTEEGKKFLKAKAKARELEFGTPPIIPPSKKSKRSAEAETTNEIDDDEPSKKKSKKGKKKRKKGKTKGPEGGHLKEKRPETEERQRNESLAYLQLWFKHRAHWKFEKLKQMWLLQHANSVEDIDDNVFQMLLEYIGSTKGAAKAKTLQEMQEFMAGFEKTYGRQGDEGQNSVFSSLKPEKSLEEAGEHELKAYDRARKIVQILSDN